MTTHARTCRKTALLVAAYGPAFWLWFAMKQPGYEGDYRFTDLLIPLAMIALSLSVMVAVARSHPKWALGLSTITFFPVGYYFLLGNSWGFRTIGVSNILIMAISAYWLRCCRRSSV